jgi:oxygen-independent coproporphyrinogen-3 oxidase
VLEPEDLEEVLAVAALFPRAKGAEWTVEANPGTVNREKLALLVNAGVNRLSLGVQSFDDDLLSFLGRIHTAREAEEAWDMARAAGFYNLNLDLIYAIPGQALSTWRRTLKRALSLRPEHLSAYSLTIEPGTEFGRRAQAGSLTPVAEELDLSMYRAAQELLGEAGLKQYEISNFARSGFECRHNLVYWCNEPYLGLGPAATSYLRGVRRTNRENVGEYVRALAEGEDPAAVREIATSSLAMAETVILGLRLISGITWERFANRFGCDLRDVFAERIRRLTGAGLLEADERGLRLTSRGLPVANRVFQEFLP